MSEKKLIVGNTYVNGEGTRYEILNDITGKNADTQFPIIALSEEGHVEQFTEEGYFFDEEDREGEAHTFDLVLKTKVSVGDVMQADHLVVLVSDDAGIAVGRKDDFSGTVVSAEKENHYPIGHHSTCWSFRRFKKIGVVGDTTLQVIKKGETLDEAEGVTPDKDVVKSLDELLEAAVKAMRGEG